MLKQVEHTITILIVDDDSTSREILSILLRNEGYQFAYAANGSEALAKAAMIMPDLVLLDVMMPGIDGYEVCRQLRVAPGLAEVPIVMVTALDGRESRLAGIEAGADDYITKPYDRIELRTRIRAITRLNRYRRLLHERSKFEHMIEFAPNGLLILDADGTILLANPAVIQMLGLSASDHLIGNTLRTYVTLNEYTAISEAVGRVCSNPACTIRFESALLHHDDDIIPVEIDVGYIEWDGQPAAQIAIRDITALVHTYNSTLEGWARALELRDKETEGHTQRATEWTVALARSMGLNEAELVHVYRGSLLHDIGKMGIPDAILLKPGPLSDDEWVVMRQHPVYAYDMLVPIVYLQPALDIPYCHHEKWDGTGYPRGLQGEQIPLAARIFAVVDVWDALRSERPYRTGWPEHQVCEYIRAQAGSHFDPQVVAAFLRLHPHMAERQSVAPPRAPGIHAPTLCI